jgi:hypothetical protein
MKKHTAILTVLLMLTAPAAWAASAAMCIGARGISEAVSCTTANDSNIINNTGNTNSTPATFLAQKITLAATTTVTEYVWNICAADAGNHTAYLYTDSSNLPGTAISGTDVIMTGTNIGACGSPAAKTFTLATPKTGVAAGGYWLVIRAPGSFEVTGAFDSSAASRLATSPDGTTWTPIDNTYIFYTIMRGCQ